MRSLLGVCIGLIFTGSLAAQSEAPAQVAAAVPAHPCLGGKLVAIQQDSISLEFNQKITAMRLSPGAVIWRRGANLESIHRLVVGDEIYAKCTRAAGPATASVVAAVEEGDSVRMEPDRIVEYRGCRGYLVAATRDMLSVRDDRGKCVMRVNASTEIWRGEILHDTSGLKLGDVVQARAIVEYPSEDLTAEEVWANITITEGTIIAVRPDRIVVDQYPGADKHSAYPRGHVTVLFDARTAFDHDGGKLQKGGTVRAVGLDLGNRTFRASTIALEK